MDQKGADYIIDQTQKIYLKKTLQFLVPISIISFLVSYFSVFSIIFHPLQFYSSIFPFFNLALDRKCMFLLCNGILAFLAKNLKLNTSALNHGENFDDEYRLVFRENAAYVDHASSDAAVQEEIEIKVEQKQDDSVSQNAAEEMETEEWDEDEDEDEGDDDDKELEESEEIEESSVVMEEVSDMRVSTEELNKKFDEFIRKMKEEIRIEARQQYLIAV